MMRKRFTWFLCSLLLAFPLLTPLSVWGETLPAENSDLQTPDEAETEAPQPTQDDAGISLPVIESGAAIVMDSETGTILYEYNAREQKYPASITKILTALLAVELGEPADMITLSQTATALEYGAAHIALKPGEEITLKECLYGLLLNSANDCANGIAENLAGSNEAFAALMNARARELGAVNTHFTNPSGLHDDNHYTTAYDMALITKGALQKDVLLEISSTITYTMGGTNLTGEERYFHQKHRMAYQNNDETYTKGTFLFGKTGYTDEARNTLVTCIEHGGAALIVVVLDSPSGAVYEDTTKLLDYGFARYAVLKSQQRLEESTDATAAAAENPTLSLSAGTKKDTGEDDAGKSAVPALLIVGLLLVLSAGGTIMGYLQYRALLERRKKKRRRRPRSTEKQLLAEAEMRKK